MREYDLIFGIGVACSCTQTLRKAGLQLLSFPYDWLTPVSEEDFAHDLASRVDAICNGFPDWLDERDFAFHGPNTNGKDKYYNARLRLIFLHDFPMGVPLSQSFPAVRDKYRRRIERLLGLLRESKRVLVVRLDRPDLPFRTSLDDCRLARRKLAAAFPGTRFDFLLIQPDEAIPFERRTLERPEDGLERLAFDYRDTRPGADPSCSDFSKIVRALDGLFAVRDYRTAEEIRAHDLRRLRSRWAKFGADTALEYRWKRLSLPLARAYVATLGQLVARLRRKRFDQIVPVGVNCETAFRFFRKWGFVDSSLFAWAQSRNLATVAAALARFDAIAAGPIAPNASDHLWLCGNSGVRFHGKLKWRPGATPTQDELDADLADLRERVAHLKRKFLDYLRNEKSTLFVHRLAAADAVAPDLAARLDTLEAELVRLGARNWRLLVICERKDLGRMPPGANRIFRAVAAFNPGSDIANARRGDAPGWNAVFSEFAPARILAKAHSFKFE